MDALPDANCDPSTPVVRTRNACLDGMQPIIAEIHARIAAIDRYDRIRDLQQTLADRPDTSRIDGIAG